ncbi:MAG: group II intron reverse transcriptase/maturase [Prolixibacteraceae bacterium]|nr:group II intron reverse transcriptase/maturase [Prolixibacteraceae bacterium]MDD2856736.1 group II intron reverse transcriptase/maturase [Desulfuromonadaceae bacterium]
MNEIKKSCASTDQKPCTWDNLDWNKCEREVQKLQARIVKAQKEGRYNKVKALQWTLTHSFSAKALAVKRVTSNKGKYTSGVDRVLWDSSLGKWKAIFTLKRRGYSPKPLKRVHIKKSNGKLRPLGIPTMKDRAMQALYLMALDPVAETTADNHSYGFRKERSTADAIEQCFIVLSRTVAPEWVLEADIKGCFDHISHEWLLNNIPMDKMMLRKWLKCGFVFNKILNPTEEGTPQGGIISPTLANMALDGIQRLLEERFRKRKIKGVEFYPKIHLVRYADDFIITGRTKEVLENEIKPLISEFLAERGLTLSEEKTKITHIRDGFDFLGFNIRKFNNTLLTKPSEKSIEKFLEKIRTTIETKKSTRQESLIRVLNPIITGWSNYYRTGTAAKAFQRMDWEIFRKLWQWAKRRHPHKSKEWVKEKYYRRLGNQAWCFSTEKETRKKGELKYVQLNQLAAVKTKKHVKIRHDANPYDTEYKHYFQERETRKKLDSLKGKSSSWKYAWELQKRKCPICETTLNLNTDWEITRHFIAGKAVETIYHEDCYNNNVSSYKKEAV